MSALQQRAPDSTRVSSSLVPGYCTSEEETSFLVKPRSNAPWIGLGDSIVLTLVLHGYNKIADLAGPIAGMGLHRRIGAVVDEVCAKHKALRINSPSGLFRLAWFSSQQDNINHQEGMVAKQCEIGCIEQL